MGGKRDFSVRARDWDVPGSEEELLRKKLGVEPISIVPVISIYHFDLLRLFIQNEGHGARKTSLQFESLLLPPL